MSIQFETKQKSRAEKAHPPVYAVCLLISSQACRMSGPLGGAAQVCSLQSAVPSRRQSSPCQIGKVTHNALGLCFQNLKTIFKNLIFATHCR